MCFIIKELFNRDFGLFETIMQVIFTASYLLILIPLLKRIGPFVAPLSIMYFIFVIPIILLALFFYPCLRDSLSKESIENVELYGSRIAKFSLNLLTVAVPLVGLASIAGSFFLRDSNLYIEATKVFQFMFMILGCLALCSVIANLMIWSGKVLPEKIKINKKIIVRRYSYASLLTLFGVSFFFLIIVGGYGLFSIPLFEGEGVRIDSLVKNGAADNAGMVKGLIINYVNNTPINTVTDLDIFLDMVGPGDIIDVRTTDGSEYILNLTGSWKRPHKGVLGIKGQTSITRRKS